MDTALSLFTQQGMASYASAALDHAEKSITSENEVELCAWAYQMCREEEEATEELRASRSRK